MVVKKPRPLETRQVTSGTSTVGAINNPDVENAIKQLKAENEKKALLDAKQAVQDAQTAADKTQTRSPFIVDETTGEVTGFVRDGKTFLVDRKQGQADIAVQLQKLGRAAAMTDAATSLNAKQNIRNQIELNQSTPSTLGQLTEEQKTRNPIKNEGAIDKAFALAGLTGGALSGGRSGAELGAGAGAIGASLIATPAAAPLGALIGAGVGGALGAGIGGTAGVYKAISGDKRDQVDRAFNLYKLTKNNFGGIINDVNLGQPRAVAEQRWNEEVANVNAARRNLKIQTDSDVSRFLSGGAVERGKVDDFIDKELPSLELQLQIALANPNPNAQRIIFPEDFKGE